MKTRTRGVRAGAILRASLRTISNDPRLLVFPLLWVLIGVGLVATVAILVALRGGLPTVPASGYRMHVGVVVGTLVAYFVATFGMVSAVALSRAAMESMAGRSWSVVACLGHAMRRLPAIAMVSLANLFVKRWLDKSSEKGRLRKLGARAGKAAWWAATYLVVPVLAREKCGGFASIVRSTKLFGETWREAFVGRLALGWVWVLFGFCVGAGVAVAHVLGVHDGRALWFVIGIPSALGISLLIGVRTLDHVYRSALYVFATEGVVPGPFDDPDLHEVWSVAGRNDSIDPE